MTCMEDLYPSLTEWVRQHGWIEIGQDDDSRSFIRVLDIGGMIWEGVEEYPTPDDALQAAEQAVATWMCQQFGKSQSAPLLAHQTVPHSAQIDA